MKRWLIVLLVTTSLLVSCSQQVEPTPTPEIEMDTPGPTDKPQHSETPEPGSSAAERLLVDQDVPPPGLRQDRTALVAAAGNCSACHTGIEDAQGNEVSFDSLWRNSMHALAAIDPYWQASVSAEVAENPALAGVIEDKCAKCHMPLAWFDAHANGETAVILGEGFGNPTNPLHDLAMDAVSCTSCHQIRADNLDSVKSFSGGFVIDGENTAFGEREAFGPLPVSEQGANLMAQASGYLAVQSEHMADSEMCATCHTLYTPYLNANGEVAGEFPEQMAYFEWQNSSYADSHSCQDCHMPVVEGDVLISTVMGEPHEYMRMHTFSGANRFMLGFIGAGMYPESRMYYQNNIATEATENILETQTATIDITGAGLEKGLLNFNVVVNSLTGHKFPTGFPSRRAWLHVTVMDASGGVVFESGAFKSNGFIEGNDNDLALTSYEPHYNLVTRPDQVQIYETILQTTEGEVTTTLLYGAEYAKDNRLLPAGFDLEVATQETATHGLAADDTDFIGGGDAVKYQVDVAGAEGPFTVIVELKYQSIGYRWAENLRKYETSKTKFFLRLFDIADNTLETVASVEVEVGE